MTAPEIRTVAPPQWIAEHQRLADDGLAFFDLLAATDLGAGSTEIVTHVMTPDASTRAMLRIELADEESAPSLTDVYPAAAWHEREAHDQLGIEFTGHPDLRPLVTTAQPAPLRRTAPLSPRVESPWPGLYEPGAAPGETRRRRPKPVPGVNEEWTVGGDS